MPEDADIPGLKAKARKAALAARKRARSEASADLACDALLGLAEGLPGAFAVAGYFPVGSEISPMPAMERLAGSGRRVCLPVVVEDGAPLRFREWVPGCEMEAGRFGIPAPAGGGWLEPGFLIVPLLAFDREGYRLGYGGGFYDRTIEGLRRGGSPVVAAGFSFAAQEVARVPREGTDQRLDHVVTERGAIRTGLRSER